MIEFLVGFDFHEPEPFALWNKGVIEDFESSTGIFVTAGSADEALAWGREIAQALLLKENKDESLNWAALGYSA